MGAFRRAGQGRGCSPHAGQLLVAGCARPAARDVQVQLSAAARSHSCVRRRQHRLAASLSRPRSGAGRSAWLGQAGARPSCRPRLRLAGRAGLRQQPRWSSGWPGSAPAAAQPRRQACPPLVAIGRARTVVLAVAAPAAAWRCGCRRTATPPGLPAAGRHRPRGHRRAGCGRAGRRLVARAARPQAATARGDFRFAPAWGQAARQRRGNVSTQSWREIQR